MTLSHRLRILVTFADLKCFCAIYKVYWMCMQIESFIGRGDSCYHLWYHWNTELWLILSVGFQIYLLSVCSITIEWKMKFDVNFLWLLVFLAIKNREFSLVESSYNIIYSHRDMLGHLDLECPSWILFQLQI